MNKKVLFISFFFLNILDNQKTTNNISEQNKIMGTTTFLSVSMKFLLWFRFVSFDETKTNKIETKTMKNGDHQK